MLMQDDTVRSRALDISRSFIVQAPAGSGKTSLLTQRYLKLLAHVKAPENIIAVTFTRKAAQEMRERIVQALQLGQAETAPTNPYMATYYQLGQAVLAQDKRQHWQLCVDTNRLQIMTIDALCAKLSARMPLLSQMGVGAQVTDAPEALYECAISSILDEYESDTPVGQALRTIAARCDNRLDWLHDLLRQLLEKRVQWLDMVIQAKDETHLRAYLEENLRAQMQAGIDALKTELDQAGLLPDDLLRRAFEYRDLEQPAETTLSYWQAVADLFLTQKDTVRRSIDKRLGFPAATAGKTPEEKKTLKAHKAQWQAAQGAVIGHSALIEAMIGVRQLPTPVYTDAQWSVIESLFILLPVLVAHLKVTFQAHNAHDFSEQALNARVALGALDSPSDLQLSLDYQIQHLLIDEFQDTAVTQFKLFEHLLSGWLPQEARSVFMVGDPMQSIYRFRGAEVGLFLQVQQSGIAGVPCESLVLTRNFRASQTLVDWVNQIMPQVMPAVADIAKGAVPFVASEAVLPPMAAAINGPLCYETRAEEYAALVAHITQILEKAPTSSIAILGRSRTQLAPVLQALQHANIPAQAQDLDRLSQNPLIQDLLSLLRAGLDFTDRVAWLALLRTPIVGLSVYDMTIILSDAPEMDVWSVLSQETHSRLSAAGQQILARVVPILSRWFEQRETVSLARWVHGLWVALGGPLAYMATRASDIFFDALRQETWYQIETDIFAAQFDKLFDNTVVPVAHSVQVMTYHKAKGLEFDYVIMPSLGDRIAQDGAQLMSWLDIPGDTGIDWLIAPIRPVDDKSDAIYRYIRHVEKAKAKYESARLFYVGITRAKKGLYLSATVAQNEEGHQRPAENTFLHFLAALCVPAHHENTLSHLTKTYHPRRLPADWALPAPVHDALEMSRAIAIDEENAAWQTTAYLEHGTIACDQSTQFGTLVHDILEQMAHIGWSAWIMQHAAQSDLLCQRYGLFDRSWQDMLDRWFVGVPSDKRLHWILDGTHQQAHSEWALSAREKGRVHHYRIDRCFVFKGQMWVIDYKTGAPEAEKGQWATYYAQLQRYQSLLRRMGHQAVRCALYYPLSEYWHEFEENMADTIV